MAAEPGGELGVEAGVGRDREHRAERDLTAAGLGRQPWWLDMFGRICAANLAGPLEPVPTATGEPEWTQVRPRFAAVKAARTLLSFGANAEVMSPPEVRTDLAAVAAEVVECYQSNAHLDTG